MPRLGYYLALALVLSPLGLVGCNKRGGSVLPNPVPPITVSYRDSMLGVGQVIQLTNTSSHHLYNVKVVGRNLKENSSASVKATEHLSPGETVEVGWLEFEAWTPVSGETVEIYCDDYVVPKVSYIP